MHIRALELSVTASCANANYCVPVIVRLGQSGLKVSRIILGTMSYGSPDWQKWVLGEEEGIAHIKKAYACSRILHVTERAPSQFILTQYRYDMGIQTFDTANVYSNGLSEVILGKAIKQHNLPRDEIVVLTKVRICSNSASAVFIGLTLEFRFTLGLGIP